MSEYIPTTQTVRARYSRDDLATFVFSELPELQEEFDRWLTQVKKQAAANERQRLLTLHLAQSKKMGYSRDYIIEALKGKVWRDEDDDVS